MVGIQELDVLFRRSIEYHIILHGVCYLVNNWLVPNGHKGTRMKTRDEWITSLST